MEEVNAHFEHPHPSFIEPCYPSEAVNYEAKAMALFSIRRKAKDELKDELARIKQEAAAEERKAIEAITKKERRQAWKRTKVAGSAIWKYVKNRARNALKRIDAKLDAASAWMIAKDKQLNVLLKSVSRLMPGVASVLGVV